MIMRPYSRKEALGHASILANLLKNSLDVVEKSWSINHDTFNPNHVIDFVLSTASNRSDTDFGIGAFVWNELHLQKIIKGLKKNGFAGNIIIGGPQISYQKSNLEKCYPEADVFVRGHAESCLVDYLRSSDRYPAVTGIHYARQPDLSRVARAPLEELPSPILTGLIPSQHFIRWETQRGCPFRCSFCQHRETDLGGEAMMRRNFSRNRVFEEIDWLVENQVGDLAVVDPTFNSGKQHVGIISELAHKGYSGKIALQIRPEMIKPEFMDAIIRLNQTAKVTLEFGLQTIHKEEMRVINRMNNLNKVEKAVEQCHLNGINFEISIIYGLPSQTLDSFKRTVDYCLKLRPNVFHAFPLMLLRGTELYEQKEKLGLVEGLEAPQITTIRQQDGIPHVISSPSFTAEEWRKMADIADSIEIEYNK